MEQPCQNLASALITQTKGAPLDKWNDDWLDDMVRWFVNYSCTAWHFEKYHIIISISQVQITLFKIRSPLNNKCSNLWVKHRITDDIPESRAVRKAVLSVTDDRHYGTDRKETFRQSVSVQLVDDVKTVFVHYRICTSWKKNKTDCRQ